MALLTVEVDGQAVQVPHGATVMEAANKLGIFVPHFCYHKKLSIAANCRMCLVQVEKAPKPMPACATPVTDGMKVWTHSDAAKKAQNGVMEFLLINHPLDCPICDQGGECQLQDLAVGYGDSASRFDEPKRVVFHKNLGPLISAEEMSRCIHCTRCVRFGQEVAGIMELGMVGRGERSEIVSFVGKTVDSELSGNMIDLCPVGALTSKPFRYSARTWELNRRRSIAPHDSLGSNLIVQSKLDAVKRVVPLENEEINECWLSDRDRFSYEGLNAPDRLTRPMVKTGGEWEEVDWQVALERVAEGLKSAAASGSEALGALVSPQSTLEEMFLIRNIFQGLGSSSIDFRLRDTDFSADGMRQGVPWLGMRLTEIGSLDRVLVIGSFLRQDHPLLASRFRLASRRGQQLSVLHSADDDLLMNVAAKAIVPPSSLVNTLAQVIKAVAEAAAREIPAAVAGIEVSAAARSIAASLASGSAVGIFLGAFAERHPEAARLGRLAQLLAEVTGGRFGYLGQAANSLGGHLVGCLPGDGGLNARSMLEAPRKAYLLCGVEPELDCQNPALVTNALAAADFVVAVSPFAGNLREYADVLLPSAPFTETSGTFVNCEGRAQSFNPVVRSLGESRPAWKILRVLGNLLELEGFDYDKSEAVRDAALANTDVASRLDNSTSLPLSLTDAGPQSGLERVAEVPAFSVDPLVRRAGALQQTRAARGPKAFITSHLARHHGLVAGDRVKVGGAGSVMLEVAIDDGLPEGVVRVASAHPGTADLGPMFGSVSLEKA